MVERIPAWQCIGCGRIEGAQPCIGICQDRRTDFVHATDYDKMRGLAEELAAVVRQIACTTPHSGEFERSYRALQVRAQRALRLFNGGEQSGST